MRGQAGFAGVKLFHLGVWCPIAWIYAVPTFAVPDNGLGWQTSLVFLCVAFGLTALSGLPRTPLQVAVDRAERAFAPSSIAFQCIVTGVAVISTLAIAVAALVPEVPSVVLYLGYFFGTIGVGMQMSMWVVVYSGCYAHTVGIVVFAAGVLFSLAEMVVVALPPAFALLTASLFPVVSQICLQLNWKHPLPSSDQPHVFSMRELLSLWRIWAMVFVASFVIGAVLGNGQTIYGTFSASHPFAQKAFTAVVSGAMLLMILKRSEFFNFTTLWKSVVMAIACLLLVVPFMPEHALVQLLGYCSFMMLLSFSIITISDVLGRSKLSVSRIFSAAALLLGLHFAGITAGAIVFEPLYESKGAMEVVLVLLFLLVLITASSWGTNDFAMRSIFEVIGYSASAQSEQSVEAVAKSACASYGITSREAEVLVHLLMGKSRAYIAEDLVISEETVKTHISHIYGKTGAHSKKELQELLLSKPS